MNYLLHIVVAIFLLIITVRNIYLKPTRGEKLLAYRHTDSLLNIAHMVCTMVLGFLLYVLKETLYTRLKVCMHVLRYGLARIL